MNRLEHLFERKKSEILNIYFTAGFPNLNDTAGIILSLDRSGVDMIEIGMPYSDPLADGPTIQSSGQVALKNGMTLDILFEQIAAARKNTEIPLILMGYFNQVMQYGETNFIKKCIATGIDGVILPDLPLDIYERDFKAIFEQHKLGISFLITPQTDEARIRKIDNLSTAFVYMVSSAATTGKKGSISPEQLNYFKKIASYKLNSPRLIGFGIHDNKSFAQACQYANGAIIGSAFINVLKATDNLEDTITSFVQHIRS